MVLYSLQHTAKLQACGCDSCKGALRLFAKNLHLLRGSIFSTALAAITPVLWWMSIMFHLNLIIMHTSLFKVPIGSRWLLVGIHTSVSPFFIGSLRWGVTDYVLRVFWLEFTLSELPF